MDLNINEKGKNMDDDDFLCKNTLYNNDNYSFLKAIEHNILEKKIFEINAKRNDRNYS
ncbi:hypothetical protein H8356DRAFT_1320564 [Neocallimastix lanati (nom. inval.)]|nr:hypothetical protein H8356DRAFT_1320564 [Neocallimastix sp. JGI-2020a]